MEIDWRTCGYSWTTGTPSTIVLSQYYTMALRSMNLARRMCGEDLRYGLQGVSRLHTSSRMQMGFGSHSSDNDPDVLHKEKEKHLAGEIRCLLCIACCVALVPARLRISSGLDLNFEEKFKRTMPSWPHMHDQEQC